MESRDGTSSVDILEDGPTTLRLRHRTMRVTRLAGPHWHPELTETFTVRRGRLGVRVDGLWHSLGPGESVTIPARAVHESRVEAAELEMEHEIRPPGRHRQMFELMFALDRRGLLGPGGVPLDPLALGVLWRFQDGYLVGVPPVVQRVVFGGLDRLARITGRHRRLALSVGLDPVRWEA